ncbi:SGNH/GDSL hydrolase family protein [Streptomyces sp. NRRL F-5630]|uniref:SGNH/GDSL hydrolase family protein n=1 Tax=Streptomyces sp. NRRL F-5630 TaxID=1463864 RepID=UPI003EC0E650
MRKVATAVRVLRALPRAHRALPRTGAPLPRPRAALPRTGRRTGRVLAGAGTAALLALLPACSGSSGRPGPPGEVMSTPPATGWDRHPSSVAAVGDSITRGFDACSVLADCPAVSWSTGTEKDVHSLAWRLLGGKDVEDHAWNLAKSGARVEALPEQMKAAAKHRPALVTVLIGANDACRSTVDAMTPVAEYRADIEKALDTLHERAPDARVYFSSIPDLKRLWELGRTSDLGKEVWKLGICPSMLSDPDALDKAATERRDKVEQRVNEYNKAVQEICAKDKLCRDDGGAANATRFTAGQLSRWDWFHPSRAGQATLARIAYERITASG